MKTNGKPRRKIRRESIALTKITVKGFKSIHRAQSIEIRPLTILAGANSSGKSSMMQPLLLLKQTLDATYDPGPLLINGPNAKFTSVEQILSRTPGNGAAQEFSVTLEHEQEGKLGFHFAREKGKGVSLRRQTYSDPLYTTELRPGMTSEDLYADSGLAEVLNAIQRHKKGPKDLEWRLIQNRCFLEPAIFSRAESDVIVDEPFLPNVNFGHLIRGIIHLPGLRGNPERVYPVTAIGRFFDGTFEKYVASVIAEWGTEKGNREISQLAVDLKTLGLTSKVAAKSINDAQVELRVGRLPPASQGQDLVNIADVGFGVSQTLPVVTALILADSGEMVYVEQPEIHLHPRAQVAMAQLLANAAKRGVRVVVETHSSLLLLAIQTLVAEGKLPPELVKLHWFTRDPKDGATTVRSADIDEAGAFGENWPEDFGSTELEAQRRYLDAADMRLAEKKHG